MERLLSEAEFVAVAVIAAGIARAQFVAERWGVPGILQICSTVVIEVLAAAAVAVVKL